jgi:hydrogenase maturation protease
MSPEDSSAPGRKLAVVGVGNILLRDEGVGVAISTALDKEGFLSDSIDYFDGGTSIFSLVSVLEDYSRIILVDAAEGGGPPGSVYFFSADDIKPAAGPKYSLHDMGIHEELKLNWISTGRKPVTSIIGVEPFEIALGDSLSDKMQQVLDTVLEKVRKILLEETGTGR